MENKYKLGLLVKKINLRYEQIVNCNMKKYGLTKVQSDVLMYLDRNHQHDITQRELEQYLGSSNPTVTGILNRLEQNGFIERIPSKQDARYKNIVLTKQAMEMHSELKQTIKENETNFLSCISEEEREQLRDLLIKVLNHMEENI